MLMDLLAAAMGFIVVMMLLSLIITTLSQAVQSFLRLRGRNLYKGICVLLDQIKTDSDIYDTRELAEKICKSNVLMPVRGGIFSTSLPLYSESVPAMPKRIKLPLWLTGIERSVIEVEDFKDAFLEELKVSDTMDSDIKDKLMQIDKLYPRLEKSLSKRFQFIMRKASFVLAIVVAFVFQVSAPDLIHELTTNSEKRAQYLAVAESVRGTGQESLDRLVKYEDVSSAALDRLQEQLSQKNPEYAKALEEISGQGETKADMLDEMSNVLSQISPGAKQTITAQYDQILTELYKEQNRVVLDQLRAASDQLATLDIRPWSQGERFYIDEAGLNWRHMFGVMMTAIFLTLGAPFWYKRLQEAANLRDALTKKSTSDQHKSSKDLVKDDGKTSEK